MEDHISNPLRILQIPRHAHGPCQNSVLKSKILSTRSGKSVDKFRGSECSAPKSNPSGSGKPIVEGVGPKMQPAEMQAVSFRGLS